MSSPSSSFFFLFFFFFFQAEDGIRDLTVTGVQTCALPIFGRALFASTAGFAAAAGYRKLVIQVRGSNAAAQRFYGRLGFVECGRLRAQVVIDGRPDDEVVMEYFL